MVEYHIEDRSHEAVIRQAGEREVGVLVKKGLASGHLPAGEASALCWPNADVASLVVGGLNLAHFPRQRQDSVRTPDVKSRMTVEDSHTSVVQSAPVPTSAKATSFSFRLIRRRLSGDFVLSHLHAVA